MSDNTDHKEDSAHRPTDEANLAALHDTTGEAIVYEDDSDDAEANKTVYIFEQQFENLRAAGFSENAIKKAYASGCVSEKTATQWITMQLDHPELNTPLDPSMGRVVIKKKVILTAEQRVAKIAELKAKIQAKKEAAKIQAKNDEIAAEKARIAGGKIAMEMKEEMQARARAQAYAEQRREKEEVLIAKEKVQLQLAIDKLIRKGKSVEEAEAIAKEEMAENRRKREEAAAALMAERRAARAAAAAAATHAPSSSSSASAAAPSSSWNLAAVLGEEQVAYSVAGGNVEAVRKAADIEDSEPKDPLPPPTREGFKVLVEKMRAANPTGVETTLAMLRTVVSNIIQSPLDQKKRYLKASNSHYKTKIAITPYALSFLKLLGFQVGWIEVVDEKTANAPPVRGANALSGAKIQEQTIVMNSVIMRRVYAALEALE